jgi:DNA-damage-inducible protein J
MAANAVVRSRISVDVKEKAAAVLEKMGLTVSDVMRIVLTRETMRKSAQGMDVHQAKDAADLFHKLGI